MTAKTIKVEFSSGMTIETKHLADHQAFISENIEMLGEMASDELEYYGLKLTGSCDITLKSMTLDGSSDEETSDVYAEFVATFTRED